MQGNEDCTSSNNDETYPYHSELRRLKVLIGIVTLYDTTLSLFHIWLYEPVNTVIHVRDCNTHHSNDIVASVKTVTTAS